VRVFDVGGLTPPVMLPSSCRDAAKALQDQKDMAARKRQAAIREDRDSAIRCVRFELGPHVRLTFVTTESDNREKTPVARKRVKSGDARIKWQATTSAKSSERERKWSGAEANKRLSACDASAMVRPTWEWSLALRVWVACVPCVGIWKNPVATPPPCGRHALVHPL
jgi:hypothetical protein